MNLATFLLNNTEEYNGHKQMEISHMSIDEGKQLLKELSDACDCAADIFYMALFDDGSFDIYQSNYWGYGEHPLGCKDRLILSVENQND